MTVHGTYDGARTDTLEPELNEQTLDALWHRVVGWRSFLRNVGVAGAATLPVAAVAAASAGAKRASRASGPTAGDIAILRFLAAAEIIESDLWEQYAELGGQDGGNPAYMLALQNLDGDMPQYISDNTDDEQSHAAFINAYLRSKGARAVSLERYRRLMPTSATGAKNKQRLTNLMNLNVDTSWYTRYRSGNSPDFGATFAQAVKIKNQPAIPVSDKDTPPGMQAPNPPVTSQQKRMQAIASSAGFHFAMIEQGGSSLYTTMSLKVTSLEVLRIVVAIGGVETNHFSLWHDKAGNAVSGTLANLTDPVTGTFFPDLNASGGEATQTNLILPEPCEFIRGLPECSVVRPTLDGNAGAMAAVKGLTADGLFDGQSAGFFTAIKRLAAAADAATRQVG
jgi:Ferritin-like domain